MGQINLIQFDIKIYHGYCEPNNSGCGSNQLHPFYLILSNKNQLIPHDDSVYILFLHIQGPLLVTSPKLNTYHTV